MKHQLSLISLIVCIFIYSCLKPVAPGSLNIDKVVFVETNQITYLDHPAVFFPDNPDFDISDPLTWTGNAAQYVKTNYFYDVVYQISNSGGSIAYDTEIDLYYVYDNGTEDVKTRYIGNISPGAIHNGSDSFIITNKELTETFSEAYWYN
jgi:hypothetical protein